MRKTSLAPPIIFGVLLVLVVIVLTTLWNVSMVTDLFHHPQATQGAWFWIFLIGGYVLFTSLIVGLILFMISLARQIRLNQRQQNFIDSVTHELKSPLTSLKLHLETMRLRKLPPEVQARFTELMLADVERLDALIDHVLEAARVDQPQRERTLKVVPLMPHIASAASVVTSRHHLPPEAIALEGEDLAVQSDPVGLELVLTNVLENAVKYSRDRVEVRVKAYRTADGTVEVAVSDSGVGIPRNQLKRIFQRFHRVGNEMTRIRQGTGLGLYIVKETLKQLGGTIRAESPGENLGSVFTVTLPAARLEAPSHG